MRTETHHHSHTEHLIFHIVDTLKDLLMKEWVTLRSKPYCFHFMNRETKAQRWTDTWPMSRPVVSKCGLWNTPSASPGNLKENSSDLQNKKSRWLGHTSKFETYSFRDVSSNAKSVWFKILNCGLSTAKELFKITFSKVCSVVHFLPDVNKYHLTK